MDEDQSETDSEEEDVKTLLAIDQAKVKPIRTLEFKALQPKDNDKGIVNS